METVRKLEFIHDNYEAKRSYSGNMYQQNQRPYENRNKQVKIGEVQVEKTGEGKRESSEEKSPDAAGPSTEMTKNYNQGKGKKHFPPKNKKYWNKNQKGWDNRGPKKPNAPNNDSSESSQGGSNQESTLPNVGETKN